MSRVAETTGWDERERVVKAFEDAWQAGKPPRIEDYLTGAGDRRASLLRELAHVDLERRLGRGEPAAAADYLSRYPELTRDPDAAAELVAAEFELRRRQDPGLAFEEYLGRYPDYAGPLRRRLMEFETPTRTGPSAPVHSAQPAPEDGHLPQIGKYRVVARLGTGGQAEVFRAFHPELGREVVIKWARETLPDDLRRQLIDEGRVLAGLDDPGLVRVHDLDVCDGRPFIVMEYVGGRSLREVLREGRPTPRAAAALVARLAGTLDRVHRHGILHRDLKPANVLIDPAGRPRLLDFGLAHVAQPVAGAERPGDDVCGTFQYMAPEQANGQGDRVGPRTDVFGLGAILYELLTGEPPYQGSDQLAVWERARQAQVVPPRHINPRVPRALARICLKALAAEPARRYDSAAALEAALRRYLRRRSLAVLGFTVAAGLGLLIILSPRGGNVPPGPTNQQRTPPIRPRHL